MTNAVMNTANSALKRALGVGLLPGLLGLLAAAARFAERHDVPRDTVHTLLDVAYRVSAEVGDDPTAPVFKGKPSRRRRAKVAA